MGKDIWISYEWQGGGFEGLERKEGSCEYLEDGSPESLDVFQSSNECHAFFDR